MFSQDLGLKINFYLNTSACFLPFPSIVVTCEAATKCTLGTSTAKTWSVTSLFGMRGSSAGNSSKRHAAAVVHDIDQAPPVIQLKNVSGY